MKTYFRVILCTCVFLIFSTSIGGAQVGICYGRVASNLPPPKTVVSVLQSNSINTVRIFKPDPEILSSFSGTEINLIVGVPNEILPELAQNPLSFSSQWLQDNIFAHIPPTQIKYLAVGNEIFLKEPYFTPFLVPSIKNLHRALISLNLGNCVKLSSTNAACVLSSSFPPSNGTFNLEILTEMKRLLRFLQKTDSPFMVNVYPFLSYINNPKDIGLDYALFNTTNSVMADNGLYYNNLFDATLDSFVAAMEKVGFGGVQLMVSETGWPTSGNEAASPENARIYNENIVKRTLGNVGTPRRPSVGMEVYLFDLFDEDQKNGDEYEKHFGVFGLGGEKVKIKELIGKNIGLYFSASWCPPCRRFTRTLVEVYNSLSSKGDVEIVLISLDKDEESCNEYFSKMPWFAIPFSYSTSIESIKGSFSFRGIPHLVFFDGDGNILTEKGVKLVEHRVEASPFSFERINELREKEEEARRNQSLMSLLVSSSRDYVISSDGRKIPISDLEGKMVGLYFCINSYTPCSEFTERLANIYNKLKHQGENFEIVSIFMDNNNTEEVDELLPQIPWFALPFKDDQIEKRARYFEVKVIPWLVIIGPDGKTLNDCVVDVIEEYGIAAYPFTKERLVELEEIEKSKLDSQTLQDVLVSGLKDYVITNSGAKVPVSKLVGKHLLLYFSAHWCPPCRDFTPKLIQTYHEIKAKENVPFEVIFVSRDRDQSSFNEYYSSMPWLALPFNDDRKVSLSIRFKVKGIPFLGFRT